jgi:hypothetical protein
VRALDRSEDVEGRPLLEVSEREWGLATGLDGCELLVELAPGLRNTEAERRELLLVVLDADDLAHLGKTVDVHGAECLGVGRVRGELQHRLGEAIAPPVGLGEGSREMICLAPTNAPIWLRELLDSTTSGASGPLSASRRVVARSSNACAFRLIVMFGYFAWKDLLSASISAF